jgi:hypothetical protein
VIAASWTSRGLGRGRGSPPNQMISPQYCGVCFFVPVQTCIRVSAIAALMWAKENPVPKKGWGRGGGVCTGKRACY